MGGKIKHGLRYTRIYRIYKGMMGRCYNKNGKDYQHYGARGIKVCDEWKENVVAFYDWALSHGYADDLTIDRIDVNGAYGPDNCRWATPKQQQNNRRVNVIITYKGETHNVREWSELLHIPYQTIYTRLQKGDTPEQIFGANKIEQHLITYNGEQHSLKEWARILGIKYGTLYNRVVLSGWPAEKAFNSAAYVGHNQYS